MPAIRHARKSFSEPSESTPDQWKSSFFRRSPRSPRNADLLVDEVDDIEEAIQRQLDGSFDHGLASEGGEMKTKKKDRRRDTKMRFSFIVNNEGGHGEEMTGKKAGRRPSLLEPEEEPPASIAETDDGTTRLVAQSKSRRSAARTSFYFDAVEDQDEGVSARLNTIDEGDEVTSPKQIQHTAEAQATSTRQETSPERGRSLTKPSSWLGSQLPAAQSSTEASPFFNFANSFERPSNKTPSLLASLVPGSYLSPTKEDPAPTTDPVKQRNLSKPKVLSKEEQEYLTMTSFTPQGSFMRDPSPEADDFIVMTDVPYPHSSSYRLPCTRASATTTARLKASAMRLFKFDESDKMFSDLMMRLERMIDHEVDIVEADTTGTLPRPSLRRLAEKLRSWLEKTKGGRIVTGEPPMVVQHELRLAEWIVEACQEGVMHVRKRNCRCKGNWSVEEGYY